MLARVEIKRSSKTFHVAPGCDPNNRFKQCKLFKFCDSKKFQRFKNKDFYALHKQAVRTFEPITKNCRYAIK